MKSQAGYQRLHDPSLSCKFDKITEYMWYFRERIVLKSSASDFQNRKIGLGTHYITIPIMYDMSLKSGSEEKHVIFLEYMSCPTPRNGRLNSNKE